MQILIKASYNSSPWNFLSFNFIFLKFPPTLKLETLSTEISLPSLTDVEDRIWEEGPSLNRQSDLLAHLSPFNLVKTLFVLTTETLYANKNHQDF